MFKNILLHIVAIAVLAALAIMADRSDRTEEVIAVFAGEISEYWERQDAKAQEFWISIKPAIDRAQQENKPLVLSIDSKFSEQATYTLVLHRGDSLLWWSSNQSIPSGRTLKSWGNLSRTPTLKHLPLGTFAVSQEKYAEGTTLTTLIPLRYSIFSSVPQKGIFPADERIPSTVVISENAADYPVSVSGKTLCYLKTTGRVHTAFFQYIKLAATLAVLVLLLIIAHRFSKILSARMHSWAGMITAVGFTVLLIAINRISGFTAEWFASLPAFNHPLDPTTWLATNLGDWILHLSLLSWAVIYAPGGTPVEAQKTSSGIRMVFAGIYSVLFFTGLFFSGEVIRQVWFNGRFHLDFTNLLALESGGNWILIGLTILMTGLFLFGHRLLLRLRALELSLPNLVLSIAAGWVLSLVVFAIWAGQPMVNWLAVVIISAIFGGIYAVFSRGEQPDFAWIVAWLLAFTIYDAVAIYQYNRTQEHTQRSAYIQALSESRDPVIGEPEFVKIAEDIRQDSQGLGMVLRPWPFKAVSGEVMEYLNQKVYEKNYIFQHYNLRPFVFDRERQPLLREQINTYSEIAGGMWDKAEPLENAKGVRHLISSDGKFYYLMRFRTLRLGDPDHPAEVFLFFEHEFPKPTLVYAQLFYQLPYKNLARLANYDFSIARRGHLIVEQGRTGMGLLSDGLAPGETRELSSADGSHIDMVFKTPSAETAVALGRDRPTELTVIFIFSLLFSLFSLILFTLSFSNSYLRFLPSEYGLQLSLRGSLSKRIHYWNVLLIGLAFLVIGWLTYRHFSKTAQERDKANLDYRAEVVWNNLQSRLVNPSLSADSLRRALPESLSLLARSMNIDVNLFSATDGQLVYTSQEDLAQLDLIPEKFNPAVWRKLSETGQRDEFALEKAGGREFQTHYMTLRNTQNQPIAYLGIPFRILGSSISPEVSGFIGILATLYLSLLLVAFGATFWLARTIIRPVKMVSDKVRQLRLEDKNATLAYDGDSQDELSELISDYNRMVDKLEASKIRMIKLERESAWREMARQVAHDIKNPLTTMKLSMQQLERVSSNPEQAAAYLRKAITRLIEQIDSLAQIASEFSMFANLDIQQKHDLVINDVVESVYDLFSENRNIELQLNLDPNRYHILGDKNHLLRVFNNLVINAIQAIPSDREGLIRVKLFREGDWVAICISDNGGGIPEEIQGRVFEPNFTTKTSGSGLGLAICKKIIEVHDGSIRFETREGEGTDFFIELPITAVEQANGGMASAKGTKTT